MDGAAQWVEVGLARARTGYLGTKSRGQVRPGHLLRYQFEFGRTFPRNCVANLYDSRALRRRRYSYTYHGHGMHTLKSSMIHTWLHPEIRIPKSPNPTPRPETRKENVGIRKGAGLESQKPKPHIMPCC